MPFFTVFTPTYNRAYILPQLYRSLCEQSCKDFEWLVVDDGSSDNTSELIARWQEDNNGFQICYYKIPNGGKPRAINFGITKAQGKFFFMVDSDDHLTSIAIENMLSWCREVENDPHFIGVGAAKGYPDGSYLKGTPPQTNECGYVDATNLERSNYDLDADMCEAYKVLVFRQFPMAEWPGEKFAPEQIALNEIALHGYKLRWHKEIIYICDYLEDGLTKGWRSLVRKNPMGYAMMYNHMLKYPDLSIKEKYFTACQHIALSIYGKHPEYIWKSNHMLYTILALPVGAVLSVRRKRQFREE